MYDIETMFTVLIKNELFMLFLILALGYWIGHLSIRNISFGSAGVLFVGLLFGHFGISIPKEISDLGLVLFVYSVGLTVGPRFFRMFRKQGLKYIFIALVVSVMGCITTFAVAFLWKIPAGIASGLFTGSLTNTPALAAAMEMFQKIAADKVSSVSTGYGISYPFGMISVVLVVQFLPLFLKSNLNKEEQNFLNAEKVDFPDLFARQYQVTNPGIIGKTLAQINPNRHIQVNVTRIHRHDQSSLADPNEMLNEDDVLLAVGSDLELEKLHQIIGTELEKKIDFGTKIEAIDLEVTNSVFVGKKIKYLDFRRKYGVTISRIRREDIPITPSGNVLLEMGDIVRVVGLKTDLQQVISNLRGNVQKVNETNMLPYLVGLCLGVLLGQVPIPLANGSVLTLGSAGGAFVVSLLLGHFRKIGNLYLYVPTAARNFGRDFGIMLFLAGVGTLAGSKIAPIIKETGITLLLAGMIITVVTIATLLFLMLVVFKMDTLSTMGSMSAAMTNPPALGAANSKTKTNLPALAYASVYPAALIFKILFVQILSLFLVRYIP